MALLGLKAKNTRLATSVSEPASMTGPAPSGFLGHLAALVGLTYAYEQVSAAQPPTEEVETSTQDDDRSSLPAFANEMPREGNKVLTAQAQTHVPEIEANKFSPPDESNTPSSKRSAPGSDVPATDHPATDVVTQGATAASAMHGSSTPPGLLFDPLKAITPPGVETIMMATLASDVLVGGPGPTTFVFAGPAGPQNFDVFIGAKGQSNTVNFSGLIDLHTPNQAIVVRQLVDQDHKVEHAVVAPKGILVDLSANEQKVETTVGPVTVQAWLIDSDGKASIPLAHLENIDNVVGSVGSDVLIGNGDANTFVYTAADDARSNADEHLESGPAASYGFDIYAGGVSVSPAVPDNHDTADFSRLAPGSVIAAKTDETLLPHDATGITVDLAKSVTVSTVNPETGERAEVAGSLVSTIGGAEQTDLALLAWSESKVDAPAQSTIEQIVGSGGADVVLGDNSDNKYSIVGSGDGGVSYFDGRGGDDTIDFRGLSLDDTSAGVELHLNKSTDVSNPLTGTTTDVSLAYSTLDSQKSIAAVRNVENVDGTSRNDVLEGDENDNIFHGDGGSDKFYFRQFDVVDDQTVARVGHDTIADFSWSSNFGLGSESSGSGGGGSGNGNDRIYIDAHLVGYDKDTMSSDDLDRLLIARMQDTEQGTVIQFDASNDILLQNFHEMATHSGWIIVM